MIRRKVWSLALGVTLAACQPSADGRGDGITMDEAEAFDAIGPDETVEFAGTEPFWGGEVSGGTMRYTTPENIDGVEVAVERFAGNNGMSFSGEYEGQPLDMAVTPGGCSDGMSDRTYPFVVTLQIAGETRSGCAWTEASPFEGPEAP
ncbi:COG3650 family protein [Altererythrobacter sp. MF3-039]|uniref:COG3650 family protein n=1 Tax=Altererythrobacter sp. MF3-039 TaxID=3252901 RepID=UPI00390C51FA